MTDSQSSLRQLVPAAMLREAATFILEAAGASKTNAEAVSEHLVEAEMKGRPSHGVRLIDAYIKQMQGGDLVGTASPVISMDHGTIIRIDGNRTFGQVAGNFSAAAGTERANANGLCLVALSNCGQLGRNARWAEYAADRRVASIHFVHGFPRGGSTVAPYGSAERRLGTGPIAFGAPGPSGENVILDFSVAEMAANVVKLALEKGEMLPAKIIIREDGELTDDPAVFVKGRGALTTFGGFKGYGLAVFAEMIAGVIAAGSKDDIGTNAMLSIYFDVRKSMDDNGYEDRIMELLDYIRGATPIPGSAGVTIPGDRSRQRFLEQERNGIKLDGATIKSLMLAGESAGVSPLLLNRWPELFEGF